MQAQENTTYALINNNEVVRLFTKEELPEWNEENITAIALSDEQKSWVVEGVKYEHEKGFIDFTLDEIKQMQINNINIEFEKEIAKLEGEYIPLAEENSWDLQIAEAKLFAKSGNVNDAPFLGQLAKYRNIAIEHLVIKISQKYTSYIKTYGTLIGLRQGLQDKIQSATTKEAVKNILWQSPLDSTKK